MPHLSDPAHHGAKSGAWEEHQNHGAAPKVGSTPPRDLVQGGHDVAILRGGPEDSNVTRGGR